MKRTLCFLLAAIMALALVGCGGEEGASVDGDASYTEDNLLTSEETANMFNNVEDYVGRSVNLYGEIFNEVPSDDSGTFFQMFCDPEKAEKDVMVFVDGGYTVETDNIVLVKGVVTDSYTGDNAFGGEVTCPLISAKSVEDATYADAFAPALKTVKPGVKLEIERAVFTIDKVEFAEAETRISLSVKNSGSSAVDISTYGASIIQSGEQYECQDNYDADYKILPDSIKAGATTSGYLVFPAIKQSDFKLVLDISTETNWYDGEEIPVSVK